MTVDRSRPDLDDTTVEGLGKLSEALETIEQARGQLYGFHQHSGKADLLLQEAVELLRKAGHTQLADDLARDLVGRNVIADRWTFQVVEDFDDGYYATWQRLERLVRDELMSGRRHVFEAEMKADRRSPGLRGHEARPEELGA